MTTQPIIAFIGLGHMGGYMAANLVAAGYTVHGFDLMPAALDTAASKGITIAESGEAAAAQADIVLTMLPAGVHVLSAYPALLAAAKPGTLFLDCSTIEVGHALQAAEMAQAAGFEAVDAPVSGGMVGAEAGTLTFMVGGSEAGLERVRPPCWRSWVKRLFTAAPTAPARPPKSATTCYWASPWSELQKPSRWVRSWG